MEKIQVISDELTDNNKQIDALLARYIHIITVSKDSIRIVNRTDNWTKLVRMK